MGPERYCHMNCFTLHRFWLLPVLLHWTETLGFEPHYGCEQLLTKSPGRLPRLGSPVRVRFPALAQAKTR